MPLFSSSINESPLLLARFGFDGTIHEQKVAKRSVLFSRCSFPTRSTQPINSSGVNILLHLILELWEGHDACRFIKETRMYLNWL
jgi:hypothetical protein